MSSVKKIRNVVLQKYTPDEVIAASNIIITYEVGISYISTSINKGVYLLHTLDKLGLKIVKK